MIFFSNTGRIHEDRFPSNLLNLFLESCERGSAIVEMALALPIMLMMLTGIFSFSIALYHKLELGEAVANAGRTLALERGNNDPCADATAALYAAAPTMAQGSMTINFTIGGTNSAGTITGGTSYGTSCTAAGSSGAAALQSGWPAQIHVSYPCTIGIYGNSFGSCTLNSYITETIQ